MDPDDGSNAHWLYQRCSAARTKMETPLSAMQLSIQVLKFVKSIDEDDDDVDQMQLFKVLKEEGKAKKRHVSFVFEICERAVDLRDDDELSEEALRAIAAHDEDGTPSGKSGVGIAAATEMIGGDSARDDVSAEAAQQLAQEADSSKSTNNSLQQDTSTNPSSNDDQNEHINVDELHCFQLRTRVLGLNFPTYHVLWQYLRAAGWSHSSSSGEYRIPKIRKDKMKYVTGGMAKRIYNHFNLENNRYKIEQPVGEDSDDEEQGPESFSNLNDLVDYLDEFVMPDYRATPAEIKAQHAALSTKIAYEPKAYERRCKRLRLELLEVAYSERLKLVVEEEEDLQQKEDANSLKSKYGHTRRPCEVCFKGSNRLHPRVACQQCGLVVHTSCYGLLDYGEEEAENRSHSATKVDEKGFFTCDVCANSVCNGNSNKKHWHASQSSGWRKHKHPNATCPLCDRKDIAGAMVRIVASTKEDTNDSAKKNKRKRGSRKSGESSETWAHLFCVNSLPSSSFAPGCIRSSNDAVLHIHKALDDAAKVVRETESMGEIRCDSCANKKGDLVECEGTCGRFFHRLCVQIDCVDIVGWNAKKEHKCLLCRDMDSAAGPDNNVKVAASLDGSKKVKAEKDQGKSSKEKTESQQRDTTEVDQYFHRKSGKKPKIEGAKSDLIVPSQQNCLAEVKSLHSHSNVNQAFDEFEVQYQQQFREWSFSMATDQSILLYGLGSKTSVLTSFGQFLSAEGDVVSLNGYDPNIDLNQFLDYIDQLFCGSNQSDPQPMMGKNSIAARGLNKGLAKKAASIAKQFQSARPRPLFVLIHNIDGVGLRNRFAQESLAILTANSRKDGSPLIRIAASVDNVNASMCLWSPQVEHKFDWAWKKVHTHRPYFEEVRHLPQMEATKKVKKSAGTQNHGSDTAVLKVLEYLAPRHTEVLQLLATMQLASSSSSVAYVTWRDECIKKMLTSSDTNLRTIMKELYDHKMIGSNKDDEGIELICIPSSIPLQDILNFKPN